jgi:putative SOS response-associated peptidase YedK
MCGRFTLHHSTDEVAERFAVQEVLFDLPPRYNIAPSQPVAAGTAPDGARRLEGLQWGLVPFWAKDVTIGNRLINARAETLAEKPAFKHALMRRRCLIPADGFYEWKKEASGRQPVHIRKREAELFAFAGLWEEWRQGDGPPLRTCTIITVPPNPLVSTIHDRMPAMLRPEDEEVWLDTSINDKLEALRLLQPYPDEEMEAFPVSKRVNAPGVDDATNLEPMVNSQ